MKISKSHLRRIIREQAGQLTFNEGQAQKVERLAMTLEDALSQFKGAEFPGVDHDRLNALEEKLFDLQYEFQDLVDEIRGRGMG